MYKQLLNRYKKKCTKSYYINIRRNVLGIIKEIDSEM